MRVFLIRFFYLCVWERVFKKISRLFKIIKLVFRTSFSLPPSQRSRLNLKNYLGSFSSSYPLSREHQFHDLKSGLTSMNMLSKCVRHGLISLHDNFRGNRKIRTISNYKSLYLGGGRKKSQHFLQAECRVNM